MIHSGKRLRGQVLFFLVTTLISASVACGGGGSSKAPAAPTPMFTSSIAPITTLAVGESFQYQAHATDSAGGTISYRFTFPGGAHVSGLDGSKVDWTPDQTTQARTSNPFTLTATNSTGGTTSQSWIVNTSGTVQGSEIDTYWGATGSTQSPNDLLGTDDYPITITATLPNADGSYSIRTGTGTPDGHFTILNVPAGYYWLSVSNNGSNYWTNSSIFDLGADYTGQPYSDSSCGVPLALDISGLDTLAADSDLKLVDPNMWYVNGWADLPPGSGGSFTGSLTFSCLPTTADTAYLVQQVPLTGLLNGFQGDFVPGPALSLSALSDTTTTVTGELTRVNPQPSFDIKLPGAAWAAKFNNVGPAPLTPNYFEASAFLQPFVKDRAAQSDGQLTLVNVWSESVPSATIDTGVIQYNNPYISETQSGVQVFQAYAEASDVNGEYGAVNAYATTTPQTAGFAPLMSPIQNPIMNGKSLFITGASSNTTSVSLSWTAPATGLPPYGYEISYSCADQDGCQYNSWGAVYTSSTSVTLPPGLLLAGHSYQFRITSMADSLANMASSPWHSGYPNASADVVSAPLLINSGATSAPIQGHAAVARAAQKNVIHTKTGTFLLTKNGNKPIDAKARMLARFNQHRIPQASKAGSVK